MIVEGTIRRWNEALARSVKAVEEIKEYSNPIEFEKAFKRVLENQDVSITTFWSKESLQSIPQEQRDFLEKQITEYRDLKRLMLRIFENGPEDMRATLMDFDPEKVFRIVDFQEEALGGYMSNYARLVTNCLACELIEAFENRELSEAENLDDRGDELNQEGRYEEALPYFDKSLALSPRFCLAWINKGIALKNLGKLDEAIRCYDTVIKGINPRYKKAWHNKAVALWMKGDIDAARMCVDKALEIEPNYPHALGLKMKLGETTDQNLVQLINLTGEILQAQHDAPGLPVLLESAVRFACQAPVPMQDEYRKVFFVLGAKLSEFGLYSEAVQVCRHAYEGCRELLGPEHPDTLLARSNLAIALDIIGDSQSAVNIYLELIHVLKHTIGTQAPLTLAASANYARCLLSIGDFQGCRKVMEVTHPLQVQTLGNGHEHTIMGTCYLAMALCQLGELSKAKALILESLDPARKELGEKHPATLTLLHNLSEVYRMLGDIPEACRISENVYKARLEVLGPLHHETLLIQSITANNLRELGGVKKARDMFTSALAGLKQVLSFEHPDCLTCAHNFAELLRREGELTEAEVLFEKVYHARKRVLGKKHKETITTIASLSAVKLAQQDITEAQKLMENALTLSTHLFGENHEETAILRWNLSGILAIKGDVKLAFDNLALTLVPIDKSLVMRLGNLSSEAANLTLYINNTHMDLLLTLLFHTSLIREPQTVKRAFAVILRRKGIWADVERARLRQLRTHRDPHVRALGSKELELLRKRAILMESMMSQIKDIALSRVSSLPEMAKAIGVNRLGVISEQLQQQLSTIDAERQDVIAKLGALTMETTFKNTLMSPTPEEILDRLSPDSILVDFVRYSKLKLEGDKHESLGDFYAAFILAPGRVIIALDLGSADNLDNGINKLRQSIAERQKNSFLEASTYLSNLLIKPICQYFPDGVKNLFLSPDGQLCLLPFECLLSPMIPERFLVEEVSMVYLGTSRDLVFSTDTKVMEEPAKALVVAAPDFDLCSENQTPVGYLKRFDPLDGTIDEGKKVSYRLRDSGYETLLLVGADAGYENVKTNLMSGVSIFHAATHGVFDHTKALGAVLAFQDPSKSGKRLYIPSPTQGLLQSYLALAGANRMFFKLSEEVKQHLCSEKLSALDILEMDLSHIKLVVLSACRTGQGAIVRGEGVFGFRRAFTLSGVKCLIMSLWPIADKETVELMNYFYSLLLSEKSPSPAQALHQAQLNFISTFRKQSRWPDPFLWAPFICQGSGSKSSIK